MEKEDREEEEKSKRIEITKVQQIKIRERFSKDLNNKVQSEDIEHPKVSQASKFRPYAFGDNRHNACGTLKDGESSFIYQPLRIQDLQGIAAGFYHSMGIDNKGVLYSWGKNKFKQLGRDED